MKTATHKISVLNRLPKRVVHKPIRHALTTLLQLHKAPPGEVVVLLTNNAEIQQLNHQHRNVNAPTDVLTFPAPPNMPQYLGDIVISMDFATAQAKTRKVTPIQEAAMLAVHAGLHLLGYDDQTESEYSQMVNLMNQAIQAAGLPTDPNWKSLPHQTTPNGAKS